MYINPTKDSVSGSKLAAAISSLQAHMAESDTHTQMKRQYIGGGYYGNYYGGTGRWSSYGRWILLGVIVGLAVLVWLLVCCCNRRRTRTGQKPVRYTGWATPGFQHPQQTGVVANQPISEPMAPQAYQTGNNYSGAGYQGAPQMSQGHAAPPLNSTYYNDGAMPPQYPAETRPKK